MYRYAIMSNPGHNRVYFEESKKLSVSELEIALLRMSAACSDIRTEDIEGIFYITFSSEETLSNTDISIISKLSFIYAFFEIRVIDGSLLLFPIGKRDRQYMDPNISSILKYTGKTNELFTRMMINIAVLSSDFYDNPDIRLLDPVAGKGTTLFEGLVSGYNVCGIEIGSKPVNEAYHYFKKYLETEKYKHSVKIEKLSGANKSFTAERYKFEFAKSKDDFKEGICKSLELVAGNSIYANKFYRKNSFHIIVGDLPYGVQHGNITNEKQSSLTRNPKELLNACLKGWRDVLAIGGVIVLAWNKLLLPKDEMAQIFEANGFSVLNSEPYQNFEHRVDQSIKRDIIAAKHK